jgi:hypothetical protein
MGKGHWWLLSQNCAVVLSAHCSSGGGVGKGGGRGRAVPLSRRGGGGGHLCSDPAAYSPVDDELSRGSASSAES